jgi:hypothetical protein
MIGKIKELFSSIRFWQIVAASIVIWLQTGDWKIAVISVLTGSVVVGSADSVASRFAGTKR